MTDGENVELKPKKLRTRSIILLCVLLAAVLFFAAAGFVSAETGDTVLTVRGLFIKRIAAAEDIESVELLDGSFKRGSQQSGINTLRYCAGSFYTVLYGDYTLIAYKNSDVFISVHMSDGSTLVFSLSTEDKTKALFAELEKITAEEDKNGKNEVEILPAP
ncbi:MAG TPA: hypothetical protein PLT66_00610 [Bacillota bacterium]|nr:hypothetical protein [Bacillota bacterium]